MYLSASITVHSLSFLAILETDTSALSMVPGTPLFLQLDRFWEHPPEVTIPIPGFWVPVLNT